MIPSGYEDRLKSRVYSLVSRENPTADFSKYIRLCRKRYEQEAYSKDPLKLLRKNNTLEEELLVFAYSFVNSPDRHKDKIDSRAFKRINKHPSCSRNKALARHYMGVYRDMKRSLIDFKLGRIYIEICEEDGKSETKLEDYLILELHRLSIEHERVWGRRKRAVDVRAFRLIRDFEGCKHSHFLVRYYYKIYKDFTKPKKEGEIEKTG